MGPSALKGQKVDKMFAKKGGHQAHQGVKGATLRAWTGPVSCPAPPLALMFLQALPPFFCFRFEEVKPQPWLNSSWAHPLHPPFL